MKLEEERSSEIIENWIIDFLEKVERKLREFNTETVSKKEIVIKTPNR